jgi:hypothetical protein
MLVHENKALLIDIVIATQNVLAFITSREFIGLAKTFANVTPTAIIIDQLLDLVPQLLDSLATRTARHLPHGTPQVRMTYGRRGEPLPVPPAMVTPLEGA